MLEIDNGTANSHACAILSGVTQEMLLTNCTNSLSNQILIRLAWLAPGSVPPMHALLGLSALRAWQEPPYHACKPLKNRMEFAACV